MSLKDQLENAGFTEYEVKVYLTFLRFGTPVEVPEAAEESGVPVTRLYSILKSLEKKGLVVEVRKRPLAYKVVDPKTALEDFFEQEIKRMSLRKNEIKKAVKNFVEKAKPVPGLKLPKELNIVWGYENMFLYLLDKVKHAKKEIRILSVGERIPHDVMRCFKKRIEEGVKIRFLATKRDKENIRFLKLFKEVGWEVHYLHKFIFSPDFSFVVIDEDSVMINVRRPEDREERFTVFAEISGLAEAISHFFDSLWKTEAKPI